MRYICITSDMEWGRINTQISRTFKYKRQRFPTFSRHFEHERSTPSNPSLVAHYSSIYTKFSCIHTLYDTMHFNPILFSLLGIAHSMAIEKSVSAAAANE